MATTSASSGLRTVLRDGGYRLREQRRHVLVHAHGHAEDDLRSGLGDTAVEEHEKFNVYIYGGAAFTKQYGYCTILDDDTEFQILATDAVVVEGNSGTTNAIITLTATQPLSGIPVQYAMVDGTAVAGSDYPHTSGTVWFWGELVKQITIPIHGDSDVEPDEKLTVHLSSFDPRVTLLHPDVEVSIINDDAIEFTLPGEYGGGIARLYGTVESGPRQKRAVRLH